MTISAIMFSATIGACSNLSDIGLALSFTRYKRGIRYSLFLATACFSMAACLLGGLTGIHIEPLLSTRACNLLGSFLMITIGTWTIFHTFYNHHHPDTPVAIHFHEMMLIGLAQILTDLAMGFAVGFSHMNVWLTAMFAGFFCIVCFVLPSHFFIGETPQIKQHTAILSGALLIILGIIL